MLKNYIHNVGLSAIISASLLGGFCQGCAITKEVHKEYSDNSGGFSETMMPGQGATLELSSDPKIAKIQKDNIRHCMEEKLKPYCDKVTSDILNYTKGGEKYLDLVVTCWTESGDNSRKTYGINLDNASASFLNRTSLLGLVYTTNEVKTRTADGETTTTPRMGFFNSDDSEFFAELVGRYLTSNNKERSRDINKKIKIQEGPQGSIQ